MCEEINKDKKTIFSAIQPSGKITLGNYLGAIKNWVKLQDDFNCIYALADLHTITVRQDPKVFNNNILQAYALLMACGVDHSRSLFFIQSHVETHAQLSWLLSCYTQFGELQRMTQFKQKALQHKDNINLGLFSYPVLQVADILLYQADMVPIGADQKQHLELSRNIAQRFNNIHPETFKLPEPYISQVSCKIMSLQEPDKKMSKSDPNENSYISILDTADAIVKKIKRSVTDSDNKILVSEEKPGVSNLVRIYCAVTDSDVKDVQSRFEGVGYGKFKLELSEAIIEHLRPIQENFNRYINDKAYLEQCYKHNARKALQISKSTLSNVMEKIGFVM